MKTGSFSWKRAYILSAAVHVAVLSVLGLLWTGVAAESPKVDYVIDLDMYDDAQLGGGGSGGAADLFPEPLSQEEAAARIEAATAPAVPITAAAEKVFLPSEIAVPSGNASQVNTEAAANASVSAATGSTSGGSGNGGGSGSGSGSGIGSGGSGTGTGTGHGSGSGSGTGSGSGDGTMPFDLAGFADAVEANKQYPYQAVKRGLEGSVTMSITLAGDGSLLGADVISSSGASLLDKAAVQAVQAACPYPNATGSTVHFTTTLHFTLQ